MYDINSVKLFYTNGMRGALSNICHGNGRGNGYATVQDLQDAVEDSETAEDLTKNVSALNLIGMRDLKMDRDTREYTRLKGTDVLGSVHYLIVAKKQQGGT